jgi:glycosyltransferase involved in cell wall biosynthesis
MRIGLEGKVLTRQAGGIGRYAYNLLRALLQECAARPDAPEFVVFTGPQTESELLRSLPGPLRTCPSSFRSSLLRGLIVLPRIISKQSLDLFHGLDHLGLPLVPVGSRTVVTFHDVMPLTHPHWFAPKHRLVVGSTLRRVARLADRVIVPSRHVRHAVLENGLTADERITVVPEGCEERFSPAVPEEELETARHKYGLPERYVLYVGGLQRRKNLGPLLEAFSRLADVDVALVLAGARDRDNTELAEKRHDSRVLFPGWIADRDLPAVYAGADVFVYPSLGEGFGLPVLEAMSSGWMTPSCGTSSLNVDCNAPRGFDGIPSPDGPWTSTTLCSTAAVEPWVPSAVPKAASTSFSMPE